jgi:glycerophosphoryl diester phosphodiesterase
MGTLILVNASVGIASNVTQPMFIAHAGGEIHDQTYTNSLEALEFNYRRGFRFFEVDFSWTSDGELVAIHDWDQYYDAAFVSPGKSKPPTRAEFLRLKARNGLTQLTLIDVLRWAREKKDAFIVTDIKSENIKALRKILREHEDLAHYLIPQVYSYEEYAAARKLGFQKVILTLYMMKINPSEVIDFAARNSPFAVTMPWKVAESGLAYYLYRNGTFVYAHTINDIAEFAALKKIGVGGIYTDNIAPP